MAICTVYANLIMNPNTNYDFNKVPLELQPEVKKILHDRGFYKI